MKLTPFKTSRGALPAKFVHYGAHGSGRAGYLSVRAFYIYNCQPGALMKFLAAFSRARARSPRRPGTGRSLRNSRLPMRPRD